MTTTPDWLEAARSMLMATSRLGHGALKECRLYESQHAVGARHFAPEGCPACRLRAVIASEERMRADRRLPCGCVRCICEDLEQCHGCGADEASACQASRLSGGPRHAATDACSSRRKGRDMDLPKGWERHCKPEDPGWYYRDGVGIGLLGGDLVSVVASSEDGDECGGTIPIEILVAVLRDAGWTCEPPKETKP